MKTRTACWERKSWRWVWKMMLLSPAAAQSHAHELTVQPRHCYQPAHVTGINRVWFVRAIVLLEGGLSPWQPAPSLARKLRLTESTQLAGRGLLLVTFTPSPFSPGLTPTWVVYAFMSVCPSLFNLYFHLFYSDEWCFLSFLIFHNSVFQTLFFTRVILRSSTHLTVFCVYLKCVCELQKKPNYFNPKFYCLVYNTEDIENIYMNILKNTHHPNSYLGSVPGQVFRPGPSLNDYKERATTTLSIHKNKSNNTKKNLMYKFE